MNHGYNTSRVKTNSKGERGRKGGRGKKEERGRDVTSLDVNAHRGETIMSRRNYMLSKPLSPCYRANRHCVKFDARKNWQAGRLRLHSNT